MSVRYYSVDEVPSNSAFSTADDRPIFTDNTYGIETKFYPDYDRRRRCRSKILTCIIFVCVVTFVLFVIFKGLNILSLSKKPNTQYGLQMIPDLRVNKEGSFIYSIYNNSEYAQVKRRYVSEIDEFLEIYWKEQLTRRHHLQNCSISPKKENKWCKVDLDTFGEPGCTKSTNYGFDTGEPCLLFAFKDEIGWSPQFTNQYGQKTQLPFRCDVRTDSGDEPLSATYYPRLIESQFFGGIDLNKIPSKTILDKDGYKIVDDEGIIMYDTPPLVWVKLRRRTHNVRVKVFCKLIDNYKRLSFDNLRDFIGLHELKFMLETYEDI